MGVRSSSITLRGRSTTVTLELKLSSRISERNASLEARRQEDPIRLPECFASLLLFCCFRDSVSRRLRRSAALLSGRHSPVALPATSPPAMLRVMTSAVSVRGTIRGILGAISEPHTARRQKFSAGAGSAPPVLQAQRRSRMKRGASSAAISSAALAHALRRDARARPPRADPSSPAGGIARAADTARRALRRPRAQALSSGRYPGRPARARAKPPSSRLVPGAVRSRDQRPARGAAGVPQERQRSHLTRELALSPWRT